MKYLSVLFLIGISSCLKSQPIANYVNNGSFEELDSCLQFPLTSKVKNWTSIDTSDITYELYNYCKGNIPGSISAGNFQFEKNGSSFVGGTVFCANCQSSLRYTYLRNKLKAPLKANRTYCVKFFVNVRNYSTVGIDAIGAYFGDNTLDTIQNGAIPITYLIPQINNASSAILSDTLNWVPVTGTFTALGNEKYMVIGCFKKFNTVNYLQIGTWYPGLFCDFNFDDASCIEQNIGAYAGPDKSIIPGDSVYLGRASDFAIDPYCYWFKLPNTTTAIDTSSGIWVKPSTTSTYVVKQELECNTMKWDTVVVYMNLLGIAKQTIPSTYAIGPNPCADKITINSTLKEERFELQILDSSSRVLLSESLTAEDGLANLHFNLNTGLYLVQIITKDRPIFNYKLFVNK